MSPNVVFWFIYQARLFSWYLFTIEMAVSFEGIHTSPSVSVVIGLLVSIRFPFSGVWHVLLFFPFVLFSECFRDLYLILSAFKNHDNVS